MPVKRADDERRRRPAADTPSWGRVLVSTGRVWLGRRLPSRTIRRAGAVALAAVVVVAGAAIVLAGRSADPDAAAAGVDAGASARTAAARWIATEVRRGTKMACEKAMCAELRSSGVSASDLVELAGDSTQLGDAQLVISSRGVRKRFGPALDFTTAPDVLGIFGDGDTRVEVRQRSTYHRATHDKIKARERKTRQKAGLQLLDLPHVHTSSNAMHDLADGEVDNRLVYALARLAHAHTINVTSFGGRGPFTGIDIPERSADIDQIDGGAAIDDNPVMASALRIVRAQHGAYRLSGTRLIASGADGGVLRLSVTAPTPDGLLAKGLPSSLRPKPHPKPSATKKPVPTANPSTAARTASGTGRGAMPTPSP